MTRKSYSSEIAAKVAESAGGSRPKEPPFLWGPALPARRLSSPWIAEDVAAPISTHAGGLRSWMNVQGDFAKQSKKALVHFGIEEGTARHRLMELLMHGALEAEGMEEVEKAAGAEGRPRNQGRSTRSSCSLGCEIF